jgi:hypothetical protein
MYLNVMQLFWQTLPFIDIGDTIDKIVKINNLNGVSEINYSDLIEAEILYLA